MYDTPPMTRDEQDAYSQGFEAAFDGKCELFGNPYFSDDNNPNLAACWLDGYHAFFDAKDDEKDDEKDERRKSSSSPVTFTSQDPVLRRLQGLTIDEVGALINLPVAQWPGRCYELASRLVQALDWSDAQAVYGLYLGPIAPGCEVFEPCLRGATRHGWILTREGVLVDPTAWVFLAEAPFLRVLLPGSLDAASFVWLYDEGAESLAPLLSGAFPRQDAADVLPVTDPALLDGLAEYAKAPELRRAHGLTLQQFRWFARQPYSRLSRSLAQALYGCMTDHGLQALIPIDYRNRLARESRWASIQA